MITFKTETRRLGDLIPWNRNPRKLSKKAKEQLKKSLEKFGYVELAVINSENVIIAGHMRTMVAKELWGADREVEVRVASENMTPKEFEEYNIRSNANMGEWDFDILSAEFERGELEDWGLTIKDDEKNEKDKKPKECPNCGELLS